MEAAYEAWKKQPTPENMGTLLDRANPVLDSALRSYGGGNQALRPKARRIAIDAFKTYDPKKGAKLSSHLMNQLQPLTRHAREYGHLVKIPERISLDLYRLSQAEKEHSDTYNRPPSDRELADKTGMSMRRISKVRGYQRSETAESTLTESDEGDRAIMYPGVSKLDPQSVWLEYVHHDSSPIDQQILEWRTGYNGKGIISNNEIAKRLNLSASAVSQRAGRLAQRLAEGQGVV
jgi:DNA-directed RNA polymerase specialized sigma subunit